jgi:hypothetical protein
VQAATAVNGSSGGVTPVSGVAQWAPSVVATAQSAPTIGGGTSGSRPPAPTGPKEVALTLRAAIPAAGSKKVDVGDRITLEMSTPLDPTSISEDNVYLEDEGGTQHIPAALQVRGSAIVIWPDSDLAYGTSYTLRARKGIKSKGGATLADDLALSFSTQTGDDIRAVLPDYYDFLKAMMDRGYAFWDFDRYAAADKNALPPKLLVLRHDVHQRDIPAAYDMYAVEHYLFPQDHAATYFVMLNHPAELDKASRLPYLRVIDYLAHRHVAVDVQPHISPWEMMIAAKNPSWSTLSLTELTTMVNDGYSLTSFPDGQDIDVIGPDFLDLQSLNSEFETLFKAYNQLWKAMTGLEVRYYAAHGTPVAINHTLLGNGVILDQRLLLATGIYAFDVYNTTIFNVLSYLSDADGGSWILNPSLVADGRYEVLAHPYVWKAALRGGPGTPAIDPSGSEPGVASPASLSLDPPALSTPQ